MKPFVVSPQAADDLGEIWEYFAREATEEIADRIVRKLVSSFAGLANTPGLGHRRSDLTKLPVHFFLVDPYLIVYQRDTSPLAIHSVLHAARDLPIILRDRPL